MVALKLNTKPRLDSIVARLPSGEVMTEIVGRLTGTCSAGWLAFPSELRTALKVDLLIRCRERTEDLSDD